jgi:hypothetical protein
MGRRTGGVETKGKDKKIPTEDSNYTKAKTYNSIYYGRGHLATHGRIAALQGYLAHFKEIRLPAD